MSRKETRTSPIRAGAALSWGCAGLLLAGGLQAQPADSDAAAQELLRQQALLRQQERERTLREQQESRPHVRLEPGKDRVRGRLPTGESPCFRIDRIVLEGELAQRFQWALDAADPREDVATGRCLGTDGVNMVMGRIQDAIIAKGFVTTRVLASPQDLGAGVLTLTVVPGRVRAIRFADGSDRRATLGNAMPAAPGEVLNLRDVEQALENFQRIPTVAADVQIVPADGDGALPGQSDLVISWQQRSRWRINLSLDDSGSESTGKWQGGATLSLDNPLGWNDLFYVNLGRDVFNGSAKGTSSWTAHYDAPVDYWMLGATASSYDYRQTVVGPFEQYVYSGNSRNAEVRVARTLLRSAKGKSDIHLRGWWRESDNSIDDAEIEVQRRRMAGWELGASRKQFIGAATLEIGVAYRRGTGAFDALPAPEELFGEGTSRMVLWTANAHLTTPLQFWGQQWRYSGTWRGQWNKTPLVPQDRFAIGGRYSVRGFDGEVSLTGERGWLLRNEMGLVLGGGQMAYVGLDHGHVYGPSTAYQLGDRLTGMAFGLRGGWRALSWDGFVGVPLSRPEGFPTAYTTLGMSLNWSF